MNIRKATLGDIPALGKLLTTVWQATYRGIFPESFLDHLEDEKWHNGLAQSIEKNAALYLAESAEGRVVAMVAFGEARLAEFGQAEIYSINVLPEFQRQGVGVALLEFALAELQQAEAVYLHVVKQNVTAQAFYAKHGFINSHISHERQIADFLCDEWIFRLNR